MSDNGYFIFFAVIVCLAINIAVANAFRSIAKKKGHTGYFWWCFLLGPVGWAMVIALPDWGDEEQEITARLNKLVASASSSSHSSAS